VSTFNQFPFSPFLSFGAFFASDWQTGRHPSRHQVGLHSAGRRWTGEAIGLWFLRPGVPGAAKAQESGWHTVLDVAGGHITPALRTRGQNRESSVDSI